MKPFRIYSEKLENIILRNPKYIPRRIRYDEHLKLYRRYWLEFSESYIKVQDIYKIGNIEYYTVKYPDSLFGSISFPVEEYTYELITDPNNLMNLENIINTNICYSGAQIKYWFFIHEKELYSSRYEGFGTFLDPKSKSLISDNKYYFLYANNVNGNYKNCRVVLDRSKFKRKTRKEN